MINRKSKKNIGIPLDNSFLSDPKFHEFLKFQSLYERLKSKDLLKKIQEDILIPVSIFNEKLSTLETICKYLRENLNFSNKQISSVLNKSSKSVWQAYSNSKKKYSYKLEVTQSRYFIPVSILGARKSIFGSIVIFLKDELTLSYHEIGFLLKRDERTIWTIYQREKNAK